MLKKSLLSSLLALSLASSLIAESYVYVGASKTYLMDEQSTTTFSIGYGFSKVFSRHSFEVIPNRTTFSKSASFA